MASVPAVQELADLRADLADTAEPPYFADARLTRFWERAGGDLTLATLIGVRQLLAEATRFHDYALGQGATDQKKNQVTKNLERWEARLVAACPAALPTVRVGALTYATFPADEYGG